MKYEKQRTEYNCVPATLRMYLKHMQVPDVPTQKQLAKELKTDILGTEIKDVRDYLDTLGLKLIKLEKEKAENFLKTKHLILDYWDCQDSEHWSIGLRLERSGPFNSKCIIMNDPYYGEEFSIPWEMFLTLRPKFYRIVSR